MKFDDYQVSMLKNTNVLINPLWTGGLFLGHQFFGTEKNVYFTLSY